ncbi:hypothetical protein ABIE20_000174 [Pseudomonas sp. 2835]
MKKLVPDPPSLHLAETVETPVNSCPEHPPLFSVCAGVSAEDALVHALLYLKCASATIGQAVQPRNRQSLTNARNAAFASGVCSRSINSKPSR